MTINDVKFFEWTQVKDWNTLPHIIGNHSKVVSETDMDIFVNNLFLKVANDLGIPFDVLQPILYQKNMAFFLAKTDLFRTGKLFSPSAPLLLELESHLFIPTRIAQSNLEKILHLFDKLTDEEKKEFLKTVAKS